MWLYVNIPRLRAIVHSEGISEWSLHPRASFDRFQLFNQFLDGFVSGFATEALSPEDSAGADIAIAGLTAGITDYLDNLDAPNQKQAIFHALATGLVNAAIEGYSQGAKVTISAEGVDAAKRVITEVLSWLGGTAAGVAITDADKLYFSK